MPLPITPSAAWLPTIRLRTCRRVRAERDWPVEVDGAQAGVHNPLVDLPVTLWIVHYSCSILQRSAILAGMVGRWCRGSLAAEGYVSIEVHCASTSVDHALVEDSRRALPEL